LIASNIVRDSITTLKLNVAVSDVAKRNRLILFALMVAGAALRLHGISTAWFAFDEKITMGLASADWPAFQRAMLSREMNMVAYYALVRLWIHLYFGLDYPLVFVRALSAVFSVATIPATYALGKKLFNANVGLLAAGLLAINAFHIKHAQNARSYSLFTLLVVVAALLLVRNLKSLEPKWDGYILLWILAIYTHVFAFLFLAAHLMVLARSGKWPRLWQTGTLVAGIAPMALWIITHHVTPNATSSALDWVRPITARSVAEVFATSAMTAFFYWVWWRPRLCFC
jgi:Dolichyl-phosphate-mannose-protein mannosyltransferase